MGGAIDQDIICSGEDVITILNRVFGNKNSAAFKYAKDNNQFNQVPVNQQGNYVQLISAYVAAKLNVGPGWTNYLSKLDPQDISAIAKFRYNGLTQDMGMRTMIHPGRGVQTRPGTGLDEVIIDSPCPIT